MIPSHSDSLVLFGITGDLAHKLIFPALYAQAKRGALKVPVIGVALPTGRWSILCSKITILRSLTIAANGVLTR
jgi:glucose-6-phosphate 1-dehydrogenase